MNRIGQISEHLIVESYKSTTLNAHACGYHEISSHNHEVDKPQGRNDYQLIYIIKGSGSFTFDVQTIQAKAGSLIVYPPATPQQYDLTGCEETIYYSLNFIGAHNHLELGPIFEKGPGLFNLGIDASICHSLDSMITEFINQGDNYLQICNYYLYAILLIILRCENASSRPSSPYAPNIQRTANYMRETFAKKYTLQDYAAYTNLSVSRFTHNFKSVYEISPMKFLTKIRLEHACWFLMNTQFPIADIAHTVGYEDPFYFTRVFKKEHHMSPRNYRKVSVLNQQST